VPHARRRRYHSRCSQTMLRNCPAPIELMVAARHLGALRCPFGALLLKRRLRKLHRAGQAHRA
jgi:hypothetical protein